MSKTEKPTQLKKERTRQKNPNLRNKAYKFRLCPTKKQIGKMEWTLRRCKELYNAALEERREAYRMNGVSVSYAMQANQLPAIKALREEYQEIHSQVQQDVLKRLDKAMQAFFRRVMNGENPGYPRFKSRDRYDSCTYPQGGYEVIKGRLHLSKIGHIRIKLRKGKSRRVLSNERETSGMQSSQRNMNLTHHRPSIHLKKKLGLIWGSTPLQLFQMEPSLKTRVSIAMLKREIKKAHQKIARRKKGSHRRNRAKKELSRLYRKARNKRRDFLHKHSRMLVNEYTTLVFEDLQIDNMTRAPEPKQDEKGMYLPNGAAAKGGLNKSILDAGWGTFVSLCTSKAEEAGCAVVKVAPHGTSQVCSGCGCVVPKDLGVRWHSCPHCGCELDRDHNAARNILSRYQQKSNGAGSVPQQVSRR